MLRSTDQSQYETYVIDSATGWTEETLREIRSTTDARLLHHKNVKNNVRRGNPSSRVVPVQHAVRCNRRTHHTQLPHGDSAKPSDTIQSHESAELIAGESDGNQVSEENESVLNPSENASLRENTETEIPDALEVLHLSEIANDIKNESTNNTNVKLNNLFATGTHSLPLSETDTQARPILTAAAQGDTLHLAELLTSLSADRVGVDVTDINGRTALMHAAFGGHKDCFELLLKAGAVVNLAASDGSTVLHQVAISGADSILSLLLHHKATKTALPDSQGRVPLHWAVYAPNTKCLSLLLDECYDTDVTDSQGMTPLMWAASMSQPDHLEQLMGRGASLSLRDNEGTSAIHWSVNGVGGVEKREACFKLLLSHESSCYRDSSGRTVMHYIAENSAEELLSLVLSIRYEAVHDTDSKGRTPLHWASVCNKTDILHALLISGASLSARDNDGMTALDYAVAKGHKECIQLLSSNTASHKPQRCESQIPISELASYVIDQKVCGSDSLFTLSDLLLLRYMATGCYLQKYTNRGKGPKHRRYFWMNIDSGEICWSKHQNPANSDIRTAVPLEVRPSASLAILGRKDFDSSFKHQFCFCILCSHSKSLLNLIAVNTQSHSNWVRGLRLYLRLGTEQASEAVRANADTLTSVEEVLDRIS